jgi:Coenzyme PQQ synthesis protein D (PqqD)
MFSPEARYARSHNVVSRKIDGELIVVPVRSGVGDLNSIYTLNSVGSVLWEFMNQGHTIPDMVARICDEFEVTADQAQKDIEMFISSLITEQLVQGVA